MRQDFSWYQNQTMTLQDKDIKYRLNFLMNIETNFLNLLLANQSRKYKLNVMNEWEFSEKGRLFQNLKKKFKDQKGWCKTLSPQMVVYIKYCKEYAWQQKNKFSKITEYKVNIQKNKLHFCIQETTKIRNLKTSVYNNSDQKILRNKF